LPSHLRVPYFFPTTPSGVTISSGAHGRRRALRDPRPPASEGQGEESLEGEAGGGEEGSPTSSQVIKGSVFKVAWAKDNPG